MNKKQIQNTEKACMFAQKNKNIVFFLKDELLYHRDKVLQQNVQQVCLA